MAETSSGTTTDFTTHLPLQLNKSETIAPAPTRSDSTIDWLPNFAGLSWIAYGASSLLVISHFPSPLAHCETLIGPVYRQVIELSTDESAVVKGVAWSPAVPSVGEVAVAVENCVCLFSEESLRSDQSGIFCWTQIAVLVQSCAVESIKWTGSGDGIISGGIEVVLWKRKNRTWEIAWKFMAEQPQTMVSATWSTEGPVATAACSNGSSSYVSREESRCVLVCQIDGKSGLVKAELRHPQPASMIQWKPFTGTSSQRDVLLTCCLDGTVRLWCEIDNGRTRKPGKDTNEQKGMRRSFHVVATIEINQAMDGTLGADIFVTWAAEMKDMTDKNEAMKQCFSGTVSECDTPGRCEWLIGFGPGKSLTFWAIHCLDDISPLRFPRVTLWKRLDLPESEGHFAPITSNLSCKDKPLLIKALISRSLLFSPPTTCSLVHLLSDNSMSLSQISLEESKTKGELLTLDSHTGNILQVAVHPYSCEVELAASLDSSGMLLFWSLSTVSKCTLGVPTVFLPTWTLLGKMASQDLSCTEYSSLRWAPSVLNDYRVLLMGHAGGIDCFMIKVFGVEAEKIVCHKLCTIPLTSHCHVDGPINIFVIPLSSCKRTFISNNFMLLGVWMKEFQALSWNVTLHSDDSSESSCDCTFCNGGITDYSMWRYDSILDGNRYSVVAVPCSSRLPDPHNHDRVTSAAVLSPANSTRSIRQNLVPSNSLCSVAYLMATGCSDGSLKFWKSKNAELSLPHSELDYLSWELVGAFQAHQGAVSKIALSCCGRKIATICEKNKLDNVSTLCIWESARVTSAGVFLLEDSISLDEAIITIDWSVLGNGQLLLGVCLQNEFRVYAQRINTGQDIVKPGKLLETSLWCCIAFGCTSPPARDFLWGSGSTPVLIHERYFCLFSKWSFCMDKKHQAKCYAQCTKDNGLPDMGGTDKSIVFSDCDICDIKNLSLDEKTEKSNLILPSKVNLKSQNSVCNIFPTMTQHQQNSGMSIGCWSLLEVAERLRGPLPIYHPEALLMNLYSGNSKRACVAVRHLVGNLTSDDISATCEVKSCPARPDCIIPQIDLSKYLEEPYSTSSGDSRSQFSRDSSSITSATPLQRSPIQFNGYITEINGFSNPFTSSSGTSEMSGFIETIEKSAYIKVMNSMDKVHMLAVLDLLREVSDSNSPYGSLDEAGRRFWVAARFQHLYFLRSFGRSPTMDELAVDSSLMGWAFHSDCQDNLLSSFLSNEPTWQEMRNLGVGFWLTNATQLRTRMEKLARSQYLKRKDPKDCALLYIALNRLQVLAGLFKISKDEKDKPLVAFLSRNFQDEKNKAAALKNAYVLMGRHQLDLAIAFFLLGGDTSSAVTVCAKNHGDEQLSLVLCRLIEGYGGPLERNLISKFLIPTATEKGDYWLASLLEWAMGNYSESFMKLLDFQMDSLNKSVLRSNQAAFIDPKVGQYCLILATKNVMKNSIEESTAALLARWARLMTLIALDRCGLPLEALECLSSSLSTLEGRDEGNISDVRNHGVSLKPLVPNPSDGSNWLSSDVALHLEHKYKLDLASQYTAKLVTEHPSWPDTILASHVPLAFKEYEASKFKLPLDTFQHKFHVGLKLFKQKYSIDSVDLMIMMFAFSCNNGSLFTAYNILHDLTSGEHLQDENLAIDRIFLFSRISKLSLKATEEISCLFARYLMVCSLSCSPLISDSPELKVVGTNRSGQLHAWGVYIQAIIHSVKILQATLKKYFPEFLREDLIVKAYTALDLTKYSIFFASAWLQKDLKVLILMIHPILSANSGGHARSELDMENLKKQLSQNAELILNDSFTDVGKAPGASCKQLQHQQIEHMCLLPDDERWLVMGVCLWRLIFNFTKDQLKSPLDSLEDGISSKPSLTFENFSSESDRKNTVELFQQISLFVTNALNNTLACVSSYHIKQLGSCLGQKLDRALNVPTLLWLEKSNQSQHQTQFSQHVDNLPLNNNDNGASLLEILWEMCADPKEIREGLSRERIGWSQLISQKSSKVWTDIQNDTMNGSESTDALVQGERCTVSNSSSRGGSPSKQPLENNHILIGSKQRKSTPMKEEICFQNPVEIYKRNGELVEAICLNSINRQQAAVSSSRKGILFFNWKDEETPQFRSEYIWSEVDWPRNGWAGSESTPIPTLVSPGIGLGSKKGAHLGLGGATVGLGSLARPGRDLTGGGAFGVPGYAGVGASGLGWGTQEDFDESVDPPATIDNIITRALSSHPSRPFFLVGSSNTHVYLWEFGKEKATATYGVLPAANVPPPYALASISALQFDHYGHRFVTAALDGTICTWQLEVGGRSNIRPTESSLCFKKHALDATYVAGSGSVIAAAGYSPNNVNVVIWDTLAPTTTSQASLMCHEGGARSVSVFDNDIGSGSISPLIITGGRGGDVGLHDFRFIATGKTKRQRHSNIGEQNSKVSSTHETQSTKYGEQNSKGMLWYMPKAHQGHVTKIATIPNTSFFLTGSKDGDVKLWDAKRAELVFHWPKLHEKHTFLQPSTRSYGVVRAAVTDIQVFSRGFLSCGGDGTVKKIQLKDSVQNMRGIN